MDRAVVVFYVKVSLQLTLVVLVAALIIIPKIWSYYESSFKDKAHEP